jgi:hypothetical protein
LLQAGITLAGYHIEAGARKFGDFVRAMVGDLGEVVRPYLRSWYEAVRWDPSAAEFASDLSTPEEIARGEQAPTEDVPIDSQPPAEIRVQEAATDPQSGGEITEHVFTPYQPGAQLESATARYWPRAWGRPAHLARTPNNSWRQTCARLSC